MFALSPEFRYAIAIAATALVVLFLLAGIFFMRQEYYAFAGGMLGGIILLVGVILDMSGWRGVIGGPVSDFRAPYSFVIGDDFINISGIWTGYDLLYLIGVGVILYSAHAYATVRLGIKIHVNRSYG